MSNTIKKEKVRSRYFSGETKIIITAMIFSLITWSAFAQLGNKKEKKWQVGLTLNTVESIQDFGANLFITEQYTDVGHRKNNSYNAGLYVTYKVKSKSNFSLRLSAKMTNYKIKDVRDTRETKEIPFSAASQYSIYNYTLKSSIINISPGILWSFNYKIINPYGGFEFVYKKYNDAVVNTYSSYYDATTNGLISSQNQNLKEKEGFTLGAGPFLGFSINVFKNISIGTELSYEFYYYKLGGNVIETVTINNPTNSPVQTETLQQTAEGFKFSNITALVNLSINF